MVDGLFVFAKKQLPKFVASFSILFLWGTEALGQSDLTVNVNLSIVDMNSAPQSAQVDLPTDTILSLVLNVTDADYDDEGTLFINNQGPINLFPGGGGSNNNVATNIIVNLNNTQRGYFNAGTNTLRFEFASQDGYTIHSITPIQSIAQKEYGRFQINVDQPVSANRSRALAIYKRLVGVGTPIDNPILLAMERQLDANNLVGAAQLATTEPGFLNLVVRDFASRMSTRDESINEQFNDFTATVIGVVRDQIDARQLLYGEFFYRGSASAPVRQNLSNDILESNDHYSDLANIGNRQWSYDYSSVLERVNQQYLRLPDGGTTSHPDAAGVLTSRAFMGAHALDGTNRRLVEYTMKQFTCNDMEDWADAKATDMRVGRDIDRFPGGEGGKYQTTCRSCHSVMDGFRGAFARYDFDRNYVKHASVHAGNQMGQRPAGISSKMNQNTDTFSAGFETTDESWINNARSPANNQRFGWRGYVETGVGVQSFGRAVANSRAFSKCMVKRVYRELCKRPVSTYETQMIESMANTFESAGYDLKSLFENIAVRPECIGVN